MTEVLSDQSILSSGLVALSSVAPILKTALLWLLLIHLGCVFGVLALFWWEEHKWKKAPAKQYPLLSATASSALSVLALAALDQEKDAFPWRQFSIERETLRHLEAKAEMLTDRVNAVYPLVAREDIHKIVWMVMIEMYHDQTESEASSALSSERTQH